MQINRKNTRKDIRAQIVADIQNEIYKNGSIGDKLPSESEYSKIYGVARSTVQKALSDLENLQLIERIQGKGSFIKYNQPKIDIINYKGFSDFASQIDNNPITKTLEKTVTNNHLYLKRLRGIKNSEEMIWLTLDESELDLSQYPGLDKYDFEDNSLYEVLRKKYSVFPSKADISANAIISNKNISNLFNAKEGIPLLQMEGDIYDSNDIVVEHVIVTYGEQANFKFVVGI